MKKRVAAPTADDAVTGQTTGEAGLAGRQLLDIEKTGDINRVQPGQIGFSCTSWHHNATRGRYAPRPTRAPDTDTAAHDVDRQLSFVYVNARDDTVRRTFLQEVAATRC